MRLHYVLIVLICICLPATTSAEYYKYRDQNGVQRYTDNLADIPEDQRSKMETRDQIEDYSPLQEPAGNTRLEVEERQKAMGDSEEPEKQEVTIPKTPGGLMPDQLNQTKEALDKEIAELMKEKETLLQEKEKIKNVAQSKAYNKKVQRLNQKIREYEGRRKEFTRQAAEFNESQRAVSGKK
jgi:hypothetical protein